MSRLIPLVISWGLTPETAGVAQPGSLVRASPATVGRGAGLALSSAPASLLVAGLAS